MDAGLQALVQRLKSTLKRRGARGNAGLSRKFRIMDDSGSGTLSMAEFGKAMQEMDLGLSRKEARLLFEHFDPQGDGKVSYEEFVQGLRDPLSERRIGLVRLAFRVLDRDATGAVDLRDVMLAYDASQHPEVIAGRMTADEVYLEFMDTFEVGGEKDGRITEREFTNYYHNLSASIDDDDYFELMIRNAWHISGGEGWCANTANKRVLVTHLDGRQTVEGIENDLGLDLDDKEAVLLRLRRQGIVDAVDVDTRGGMDGASPEGPASGAAAAAPGAPSEPPPRQVLQGAASDPRPSQPLAGAEGGGGLFPPIRHAAAAPAASDAAAGRRQQRRHVAPHASRNPIVAVEPIQPRTQVQQRRGKVVRNPQASTLQLGNGAPSTFTTTSMAAQQQAAGAHDPRTLRLGNAIDFKYRSQIDLSDCAEG